MDEPDARVELRKTSDPLLNTRHAYEHHASRAFVKDGSHLFETVHLETIGLIHQDQGGRISYRSLFRSIFLIGFEVGWIHGRPVTWRETRCFQQFLSSLFARILIRSKAAMPSRRRGSSTILITFSRAILMSCEILEGLLTTEVVYSNVSTGRSSVVSLVHRECAMIFSARLYLTAESVFPIPGDP
jgi:hypothetical protein